MGTRQKKCTVCKTVINVVLQELGNTDVDAIRLQTTYDDETSSLHHTVGLHSPMDSCSSVAVVINYLFSWSLDKQSLTNSLCECGNELIRTSDDKLASFISQSYMLNC